MAYTDKFPSNQRSESTQKPLAPIATSAQPPLARIQPRSSTPGALGDGFRKVGADLVQQQLPGFIHRLLYSIVDVLIPGHTSSPYITPSRYSGYSPYPGARMPQVPPYGQRVPPGFAQQPPAFAGGEVLAQKKTFDTFVLANKEVAMDVFQGLISDAMQSGFLTVSQVYDRLGLANMSYMGVRYYWTADQLRSAEIIESPTGECRVKMPKAHLID